MGAADFDDARELFGFGVERVMEIFQSREQAARGFRGGGDVHGGGKRVVGRLRHVDVIVGMDGPLAAHDPAGNFNGAIGDHLVDVHVGLRAAARLPDAQREMVVELSADDFVGGLDDEVALFRRESVELEIDERRGFFEDAESADQFGRHGVLADGKVDKRAGGLRAVVAVDGDLDFAHRVGLGASRSGRGGLRNFRHRRLLRR
jgi:hypothetical protein